MGRKDQCNTYEYSDNSSWNRIISACGEIYCTAFYWIVIQTSDANTKVFI